MHAFGITLPRLKSDIFIHVCAVCYVNSLCLHQGFYHSEIIWGWTRDKQKKQPHLQNNDPHQLKKILQPFQRLRKLQYTLKYKAVKPKTATS